MRDAKHPTAREGNHRRFRYTREAWAIVRAQPRKGEHIFPYDPKSVSAAFTRACKVLGIADLRFHDLRHEATSRLFERGYQIHEVAQFTLHDSWNELKRYTNLKPENLRDLGPPPRRTANSMSAAPRTSSCVGGPLATHIDQGCEIGRTDQPGRLLAAQPERRARQILGRCAPSRLGIGQTEIFRRHPLQRDISFAKFRQ